MNWKKSGYLVETKAGKLGRTIHGKGIINGKIPVYIATKLSEEKHGVAMLSVVVFGTAVE